MSGITPGSGDSPFPTRRELRERAARPTGRAAATVPTKATAQKAPTSESRKAQPTRQPSRMARQVAASTAPRKSRQPKGRLLKRLVSLSAMLGAGALLVATSLPAMALQGSAADALDAVSQAPVRTQTLAVDKKVLVQAPTRDAYTVVSLAQKIRVSYTHGSFDYTNDPNGTIQWPFPVAVPISSGFGPRIAPCGGCSSFHEGVDFTPGSGVPIGAIADGVVSLVSSSGAYGNHVIIDHVVNGQKVQSLYAHMQTGSVTVAVGDVVKVTQVIGKVGSTGESTGAHLHLEIHLDGTPVDPFAWLKANAN
ncbi:M23 family metallopeptidase [Lacisediminihabitans sp.]|uniref:M23 family metallopeptidase n=1 Tax=Lacisediminihabitans sp. TaxID=2787631 RepID=UPI00374C9B00